MPVPTSRASSRLFPRPSVWDLSLGFCTHYLALFLSWKIPCYILRSCERLDLPQFLFVQLMATTHITWWAESFLLEFCLLSLCHLISCLRPVLGTLTKVHWEHLPCQGLCCGQWGAQGTEYDLSVTPMFIGTMGP